MIFFDQDSAYVFPGFPADIDQIVPKFIKHMKGVIRCVIKSLYGTINKLPFSKVHEEGEFHD